MLVVSLLPSSQSSTPLSFLDFRRADEELVDPKKYLEESCKPKCVKPLLEYQAHKVGFLGKIMLLGLVIGIHYVLYGSN
ncbi:hypothetical protein FH972_005572 [Carpinus fangiana]|uniref:Uncharacterized protein n=1 Tax=Carpinus fangiana TaxID=176857 RepID=A0A5N6QSX4_9ROSI|nr:hypothetical protein FH972_005572 [Carpinus fangiana]